MKRSLETTIDRSKETITPEKRRQMRQEELRRIYEEIEKAPTRRKKALGTTLALSTMLAVGWWYFRHERDLDEENKGDTMGEVGSENAVRGEGGGRQAQKSRSPETNERKTRSREVNERLQRLMEEAARQVEAAGPEPESEQDLNAARSLLVRYNTVNNAEFVLQQLVGSDDLPVTREDWEAVGRTLDELETEIDSYVHEQQKLDLLFMPEFVYVQRIENIHELIHSQNYREALLRMQALLIIITHDKGYLQVAIDQQPWT